MRFRQTILCFILLALALPAAANSKVCVVQQKIDVLNNRTYSSEQLQNLSFSLLLDENKKTVSRCSFQQSAGSVTCDEYAIDKTEIAAGLVDIKKHYYFAGQFDLQIFDGRGFIENNGRGSIATGFCVAM